MYAQIGVYSTRKAMTSEHWCTVTDVRGLSGGLTMKTTTTTTTTSSMMQCLLSGVVT